MLLGRLFLLSQLSAVSLSHFKNPSKNKDKSRFLSCSMCFIQEKWEKILLKEGEKISKLLSEAALEQISSLNDPSFAGNTPDLH